MSGPDGVNADSDRYDVAAAADILTAVLRQPGGVHTALGAFADVPGLRYVAGTAGRLLRRSTPTVLRIGEWEFVADDIASELVSRHVVRDVVLLTETLPAQKAAGRLAGELLASAQRSGPDADIATQSALFGLSAVVER